MRAGLQIAFRDLTPDESLVVLAMAELTRLRLHWAEAVECNLMLSQLRGRFVAHLWMSRKSAPRPTQVEASDADVQGALRKVFEVARHMHRREQRPLLAVVS